MKRINKLLSAKLIITTILCFSGISATRAAVVRGTVYDEIHDIYLTGCQVTILELDKTTYTERRGEFFFGEIPPGIYTLRTNSLGLPSAKQTIQISEEDKESEINLRIAPELIFELEALTVEGSLIGRAKALNIQKSTQNLVSVVSADAIGQFVDRNAAEALQRQPGVTVIDSQGEGKYIVIRGADPAWNQVMIDGVSVATPEENGRTTALNIISTDQLESITVTKTWTPDKPAGSIGGTVNLITRSALDRGERFASIEGAYGEYEYTEEDSWRYNLVYGDIYNLNDEGMKIGIQLSLNQSLDNRGSETLRGSSWITNTTPNLQGTYPLGFTLGGMQYEDYSIERERMAIGGKVEFQVSKNHRFYVSASLNEYDDTENLQEVDIQSISNSSVSYRGSLYFNEAVAEELGYDLTSQEVMDRLALPATSSEKRLTFDEAVALGDLAFNEETKNYDTYIAAGDSHRLFQQVVTNDRIETYQFGGNHALAGWLNIDYKIYSSEADKDWTSDGILLDTPRYTWTTELDPEDGYGPRLTINNTLNQFEDPTEFILNKDSGYIYDNEYFSSDKRTGYETNLEFNYDIGKLYNSTKIGVAGNFREKKYNRNFQRFSDVDTTPLAELTLADEYFAGELSYEFLSSADRSYEFGPRFDEESTLDFLLNTPDTVSLEQEANDINYNITDAVLKNYEAEEDITAMYFLQKLVFGNWNILAGARVEKTDNTFQNNIVKTDLDGVFVIPGYWQYFEQDQYSEYVTSDRSYEDILPALHIRYNFGEDWIARFSITKSLTRPTFTNLVPFEIISVSGAKFGRSIQLPNIDLEPMESTNYDLSLEKYFKGVGLFAVNLFYKNLDGAIYRETRSDVDVTDDPSIAYYSNKYIASELEANAASWSTSRMANTGEGDLYGVEITFDKKLSFLPLALDGLGFSANFTLVDSEVELLLQERYLEKVPLFKQSDQSGNISVYWEKYGFLARLSYVYRGEYLHNIQAGESTMINLDRIGVDTTALDTWADDFERLDLLIRYRINHNFNVFIEAANLTDEPIRFYRGNASRVHSIRYTGLNWFIGVKWSL